MPPSYLILGAGVTGLSCARVLAAAGHTVRVIDKGRGPGGRLSTRRETLPTGELRFDHGAQYLTARDERFKSEVAAWQSAGVVAPWDARLVTLRAGVATPKPSDVPLYVGTPGMSALCRHLATGLDVTYSLRATAITPPAAPGQPLTVTAISEDTPRDKPRDPARTPSGGNTRPPTPPAEIPPAAIPPAATLTAATPTVTSAVISPPTTPAATASTPVTLEADRIIVALPDDQARQLLAQHLPLPPSTTDPCWALMLAFDSPLQPAAHFDGAFIQESPLAWAARESSKPARPPAEAWVLHATPAWSRQHLELPPDQAAPLLLTAFAEALCLPPSTLPTPTICKAHRWRFAKTTTPAPTPLERPFATTPNQSLSACGDYLLAGKIEAAFLSGHLLGQRLIA